MLRQYDIDRLDNRDPELLERIGRWGQRVLVPYFRYELQGVERIPEGAALYVGNHNSGLVPIDAFLFGTELHRAKGVDAMPFGLGHEVAISFPLLHQIIVPLGAVRASHDTAHRLFEEGRKVLVYPGGDLDAMRPFRHRHQIEFGGRRGFVRLAIREGVPIVPVVTAGAHSTFVIVDDQRWLAKLIGADRWLRTKVFPLTLSVPWGVTVGPPPPHWPLPTRVLAEVLPPIHFPQTGAQAAADDAYVDACAQQVLDAMQAAMDGLVVERKRRSIRQRLANLFG